MTDPTRRVLVLASTAAACAALLGACAASDPSRPESSDARPSVEVLQELEVTVTTDRAVYSAGEPVRGRITVVNGSGATVRLRFSSSQRFDFVVRNAAEEDVWKWSAFRFFTQALGVEEIPAGESLSYEAVLAGDLVPGTYSVLGSLVARETPLQASATFTVR